jgi:hypothetical protein
MSSSEVRTFSVAVLALVAAVAGGPAFAQDQEPRSARAYCLKVASDKAAELEAFVADVGIPLERQRVAAGESKGFDLLRAVVPLGGEARCDYIAVFRYGLLPEALPTDRLGEYLKQAGVGQTAQQSMQKWEALTDLVGLEWWWIAERVGSDWAKGSYVLLNYWKIAPDRFGDYLAVERAYWKPVAEADLAAGKKITWDLVGLWAPSRSDGYQGLTINAYHDWAELMKFQTDQASFDSTWSKVQPGLRFDLVERFKQGVRTASHNALFRVVHTTTN